MCGQVTFTSIPGSQVCLWILNPAGFLAHKHELLCGFKLLFNEFAVLLPNSRNSHTNPMLPPRVKEMCSSSCHLVTNYVLFLQNTTLAVNLREQWPALISRGAR